MRWKAETLARGLYGTVTPARARQARDDAARDAIGLAKRRIPKVILIVRRQAKGGGSSQPATVGEPNGLGGKPSAAAFHVSVLNSAHTLFIIPGLPIG
jgi:hypothetical protein